MNKDNVLNLYGPASQPLKSKRFSALLDILVALAPLGLFAYIGQVLGLKTALSGMVINLGYVLAIIVATIILRLRGSGWREIGLARPRNWLVTIALGLIAFVGAILVMNLAAGIVVYLSGNAISGPDISRFNPLRGNLPGLLGALALTWTTIAFGEEMLFRAFLTDRFAEVLQKTSLGWALACIVSSALFGLAHYGEGIAGIFSNGAFGLLFALIYLRTGRNLWVVIIAHGLLNSIRFVYLYLA